MKAWHFVAATLGDGGPIPVDGETLHHDGPLVLCESGLHASKRLIDTLEYAQGETLCRVEMGGCIETAHDKLVARERTILWRIDASNILHSFARRCAIDVIDLWDAPTVVIQYLKTGQEDLRAEASATAWDAARTAWAADTTEAATWSPAAAASAAETTAFIGAWAAAAAGAATKPLHSAVWAAARDKQNRRLTQMVIAAHRRESQ